MNKKLKWAVPFAVLTLTCGITAGALSGCGGHTHDYSVPNHNDTQHWMECPEDGEKDEASIKDHVFVDGRCECGQVEPHEHAYTKWKNNETEHWKVCPDDNTEGPGTRAAHNFVDGKCECGYAVGSASGKIKLYKNGAYITDYTGVSVMVGDVSVTVEADGSFAAEKLAVGETYELKITKDGYTDYSENFDAEQGVEHKVNGGNDVVLQYKVFNSASGFTDSIVDYSKMNDGEINLTGKGKIKLDSVEKYDNVTATVNFRFQENWDKWETDANNKHHVTYYAALYFEDGKNIRVQLSMNEQRHFVLQEVPHDGMMINGQGGWYESDYHGEGYWCNGSDVADPVRGMYETNGNSMPYTITRNGATVVISSLGITKVYTLPDAYKNQKAGIRIGIETDDALEDSYEGIGFTYEIGEPEYIEVGFTENSSDFTGAAATLDKAKYIENEVVTLSLTVPEDTVATVTIDGEANTYYADYADKTITFKATKADHTVSVVFAKSTLLTKDLTVGEAYNSKTLTFSKEGETDVQLTVTGGKISLEDMAQGEWTLSCELLGTTLKTTVNLSESTTELNLSAFATGSYTVNMADGSFEWNTGDLQTVTLNLAEGETGDAYVALKLKTSGLITFLNDVKELHFGLHMTVNGQNHSIVFGNHTWQDDLGICVDGNSAYTNTNELKEFFYTHSDSKKDGWAYNDYSFGVYGAAIEDGGLYYVLKYESATGKAIIYLSDGETYAKIYEAELFEAEGTLTSFGFAYDDGQVWNYKGNLAFTSAINYGKTLNAAVGATLTEYTTPVYEIDFTENSSGFTGAAATLDKDEYTKGETVTLTITVPEDTVATVTIDGEANTYYADYADKTITFKATKADHTVSVVFAKSTLLTKDLTVGEAYNSKTLTFSKEGETDVQLTVTGGKISLEDMAQGEWTLSCELLGTTLKTTVTLNDTTEAIDMSKFVSGTADMNMATGEYKFHRKDKETANVTLAEEQSGNAYVALKLKTGTDFLDYISKPTELHFGIYMTIDGETHWIAPGFHSWEQSDYGFTSDKTKGSGWFNNSEEFRKAFVDATDYWNGPFTFGTHGEAIIGDGLYFVLEYVAATGDANMYLSDGETYVKLYTAGGLFKANGKLTAFGINNEGDDWGYENNGNNREYTFALNYGATLNGAIGKTVTEYVEND